MALIGPKHVVIKGKYILIYMSQQDVYTTECWTIPPLHPRTSMEWCV